ncbi:hypothetical protein EV182_002793 [Spiromyces aspiralis]|uniref:Uncharacterized protein n=1 Tax=Spiromyces aspiralis TaxID=68401 RepID=A0ACC1HEB1_9FUNG|nr:hypothetical protein EV182_002793 [Spiromyces aspiralis]
MRLIFATVTTALMLAMAAKKRSLSLSGCLAAVFVGMCTFTNDNLMFSVVLLTFFVTSSYWTKYGANIKKKIDADYVEGGQRSATQVFSNGLVGSLISVYYQVQFDGISPQDMTREQRHLCLTLIWAYIGFYAFCNADTWASELGVLSQSWPVLITTFKKVPPGTNGALSKLGLLASIAGGAAVGIAADVALFSQYFGAYGSRALPRIPYNMVASFVGLIGSLVDSLLGALFQVSYLTNEHKVSLTKRGDDTKVIAGRDVITNDQVKKTCPL